MNLNSIDQWSFQSKFYKDDKLILCAEEDREHIGEYYSPKGPHVRLIKEALNAWAAKLIPPLQPLTETETFDQSTGDRVALYKRKHNPPILNYQGQVDRIVGKKTIKYLDRELPPEVPNTPGAPQATVTFADVVVRFVGGRDTGEIIDGTVLEGANLTNYNRRVRSLTKIGRGSRVIGDEARPMIVEVLAKIKIVMNLPKIERGIICVYGSSAGGRNAIELAIELNRENLPLVYVGIEDAAFFPNETQTVPNVPLLGRPSNIPMFNLAAVRAGTKLNFFQTRGNHAKPRALGGPLRDQLWTSQMKGQEIHGDVSGFTRMNVDNEIGDNFSVFNDGLPHDIAVGSATPKNVANIAALLVKQSPL